MGFSGGVALALALLSLSGTGAAPPHLLLFVVDDLGWSDVHGFAGDAPEIRNPVMERLVREGVALELRSFKFCSPTRSSLLSGRYPYHQGQQTTMNMNPACTIACGIPLDYKFIPEMLKMGATPWKTMFAGKFHEGYFKSAYAPTKRGFDRGVGFYAGGETHVTHVSPYSPRVPLWWTPADNASLPEHASLIDLFNSTSERLAPLRGQNGTLSADLYGNATVSFIEDFSRSRGADERLFAYVSLHDVHVPFEAPVDLFNSYEGEISDFLRRVYASMTSQADRTIGQILDAMKASGLDKDGIVTFVTSDNGGNLNGCGNQGHAASNWPKRGGKFTNWGGGTIVPSFVHVTNGTGVSLPGSRSGTAWDGLMHAVDVYATLGRLAGVDKARIVNSTGSLPADGMDVWDSIVSGAPSPRKDAVINIWTVPKGVKAPGVDGSVGETPEVLAARSGRGVTAETVREAATATLAGSSSSSSSSVTKGGLTGALEAVDGPHRWRFYYGYPGSPDSWSEPYNATPPRQVGVYPYPSAPGTIQLPCPVQNLSTPPPATDETLGSWGLLENPDGRPPNASLCEPPHPCLFDLNTDPGERVDVAGDNPSVVAALLKRLQELARTEVSLEASGLCPPPPAGVRSWPSAFDSNVKSEFWQPWCDNVKAARQDGKECDVTHYGAKGDGKSNDTGAINEAIQDCAKEPGSTIVIPAGGTFLTWPLTVSSPASSLTLSLQGTLLASGNPDEWPSSKVESFVHVEKAESMSIVGDGAIDGQGEEWWKKRKEDPSAFAPYLLRVDGASDLRISGVSLINSPKFHLVLDGVERGVVDSVRVSAPSDSPNTDGIDPGSGTKDLLIHNFTASNGDDCVAIKQGTSDIRVEDSTCVNGHGISIGSIGEDGSTGYVQNVTVSGASFTGSSNAVRIKTWQGGLGAVKQITYENITVKDVGQPLLITQFYCPHSQHGGPCKNSSRAVNISEVTITGLSGTHSGDLAGQILCSDSSPCRDVRLEDVWLQPSDSGKKNAFECWNADIIEAKNVTPAPCK